MAEPLNRLRLELPGLADNVGVVRVAVAAFAAQGGFTLGDLDEIKVAVSEAATNVVLHAYADGPGPLSVWAELHPDRLVVRVRDNGRGIEDVQRARRPAFSTLSGHMGLGFVVMESFMDEVHVISRPGSGTSVEMVRRRSPSPAGQPS